MANKYGLDLDKAWARVLREVRSGDVPDVLDWEDFKLAWSTWRDDLERRLNDGSYSPRQPRVIEVSKDGLMIRPISLLHPMDRVVLDACVAKLLPVIDAALPSEIKSARLTNAARRTDEQERDAWLGFQADARGLYAVENYAYMLSTDVVSYFEYVDISILIRELTALPGVDQAVVQLLSAILNEINRNSEVWGLPQGPSASFVLGNFYLLPVDRALQGHPVKFLRWQDDIKIFGKGTAALRVALREVIRLLRGRKLNVSVHKTKMLQGPEILDEVEDTRKDAIQYGLKIGDPAAIADLRKLFDDAVAAVPLRARDVRFAVYRLAKHHDPHAVQWILDHLAEVPYLAPLLVGYLSVHLEDVPAIEARVRDYLNDPHQNLYPWAELHVIRMLASGGAIQDDTYDCVWAILRDQNKDPLVRQHAARCAGRHARAGDLGRLQDLLSGTPDVELKRALLVAVVEAAGAAPRDKSLLSTMERTFPALAPTAGYLRAGGRLPPP